MNSSSIIPHLPMHQHSYCNDNYFQDIQLPLACSLSQQFPHEEQPVQQNSSMENSFSTNTKTKNIFKTPFHSIFPSPSPSANDSFSTFISPSCKHSSLYEPSPSDVLQNSKISSYRQSAFSSFNKFLYNDSIDTQTSLPVSLTISSISDKLTSCLTSSQPVFTPLFFHSFSSQSSSTSVPHFSLSSTSSVVSSSSSSLITSSLPYKLPFSNQFQHTVIKAKSRSNVNSSIRQGMRKRPPKHFECENNVYEAIHNRHVKKKKEENRNENIVTDDHQSKSSNDNINNDESSNKLNDNAQQSSLTEPPKHSTVNLFPFNPLWHPCHFSVPRQDLVLLYKSFLTSQYHLAKLFPPRQPMLRAPFFPVNYLPFSQFLKNIKFLSNQNNGKMRQH